MPIAHLHVARAAGSRPSNLHYKGSHVTRSNLARAAQSLTSRRLRLIPRRRVPISFPRSWLVRIDQMARLRSNTKISLSVLIDVTTDTDQGQAHLSPRRSQPALSLRHKDPPRGSSGQRSFQPPIRESLAGTLRADPSLVITCIMYKVYNIYP